MWDLINAAYRREVLRTHPDRGGTGADQDAFQKVQAAFDYLRGLWEVAAEAYVRGAAEVQRRGSGRTALSPFWTRLHRHRPEPIPEPPWSCPEPALSPH